MIASSLQLELHILDTANKNVSDFLVPAYQEFQIVPELSCGAGRREWRKGRDCVEIVGLALPLSLGMLALPLPPYVFMAWSVRAG